MKIDINMRNRHDKSNYTLKLQIMIILIYRKRRCAYQRFPLRNKEANQVHITKVNKTKHFEVIQTKMNVSHESKLKRKRKAQL